VDGGRWPGRAPPGWQLKGSIGLSGLNDEYMSQLGATLVALLQRSQIADQEGLLVEVLEIETALATLRAELAMVAERRRDQSL